MMNTVPATAWLRTSGLMLIAAGTVLNVQGLEWLLAADESSASVATARVVSALRIVAIVVGCIMLARPGLFTRFTAFSATFTGVAVAALVTAVVAKLGVLFAPSVDYMVQTTPTFSCATADPYCNRAVAAGVANTPVYGRTVAFVDIDTDDQVDIFVVNSDRRLREGDWGSSWFYRSNGDGTFRPVAATQLGIREDDLLSAWNASFADMDNDGDPDIAIASGGYTGEARFSLYENRIREDGRFQSVTDAAGFSALNVRSQRWWGLAWADYDSDGLLDLAVTRVWGPALLFHNDGNNRFSDVTRAMGIATPDAWRWDGKNIVWFDFDNDGDQDLYFAGIENHMFYENLDGKVFRDVTKAIFAGVFPDSAFPYKESPVFTPSANVLYKKGAPVVYAAAAADFNQDGYEDLYLGRQIEKDVVLFNDGTGRFQPARESVGIDDSQTLKEDVSSEFENTMGLGVGDILDDGWPDIVIGTGDPTRAASDIVFCNSGGVFERCTATLVGNADGPYRTRGNGVAFGDANQDGANDIFMSLGGDSWTDRQLGIDSRERSALYVRNPPADLKTATVLLEGTRSNRDAIGARLRVVAGDSTHYYTIRSTQGSQNQNERATIVALGAVDTAELEITWPSGEVTKQKVRAGERTLIRE
jgi:hypothetical protein